ncbi:hypothetical protein D3C87_103010 [compost metagenome]
MNRKEFGLQAESFLKHLFEQLNSHKVQLFSRWSIDHLCFRAQSTESYHQFKKHFSQFASLLIESEVNGRLIATYKLHEAIMFHGYCIDLVELPAPKAGKVTPEGFEHVEVICDLPLAELQETYQHLKLDAGGLKKAFNQELEIEMSGCALKFHALSLESVINLEKNQRAHRALMNSRVLEQLRAYSPLVAGTFPLNVNIDSSDLDILLTAKDFSTLEKEITTLFGSLSQFECYQTTVNNTASLIARFSFEGVPFELFAQDTPSIQQTAYKHFQVEERLLKIGGESLRRSILELRKNGLKTEPAFAKALNISGDPYGALLELHAKSENELKHLLFPNA